MKQHKNNFLITSMTSLICSFLFANTTANADVIACPMSSQFVNTGDSVPLVISTCGKPLKVITLKPEPVKRVVIWQYVTPAYLSSYPGNGFAFLFSRGRVMNIEVGNRVNGIPYLACQNGGVPLGATMAAVHAACGAPYFQRNMRPKKGEKYIHEPEITKLVYKPRDYLPETIFIFKDGQLFGEER